MVQINKKSKNSKTALKVSNKAQNKLNKQKQRTKKAVKENNGLKKAHREKMSKQNESDDLKQGNMFVRDYFDDNDEVNKELSQER